MTARILLAALAALALLGCDPVALPCELTAVLQSPQTGAVLAVDGCTGDLSVGDEADPLGFLAPTSKGPPVAWADDDVAVTMRQGRYIYDGTFGDWQGAGRGSFDAAGTWAADDGSMTMSWEPGPSGTLRLKVRGPEGADRVSVAFACEEGARYYGLGARPDGTDHTGTTALLATAEQGIGQADYPLDGFNVLEGRVGDSYYPVPWLLRDDGLGLLVEGTPIVGMDVCDRGLNPANPIELRVTAWGNALDLLVFPFDSPREAVAALTLHGGPPALAPDWTWGPWIGVQRGTDELVHAAAELRRLRIPATALWAQDWIGGRPQALGGYDLYYHWEWDEALYPDLPGAIAGLHDDGFAFLGYFNPFITEPHRELDEAVKRGYLPRTPEGEPYTFSIVDRFGSVVDLANPEARQWAKDYMTEAVAMGQDGWMCDFGEWMPFDAQVGDGRTGQELHNAYPVLWHELNMEVLNEGLGAGNGLCFGRSGWTGDHRFTPVTWGGDQETSWQRDDGIATAREIGVGLGLSGVGRYGSDIAGFSSVWDGPSTEELYLRWISMGAFEPVMRTHDGLAEEENWSWEEDTATLLTFRRYARWHLRLQPFWRILDRDYQRLGLPMMRHAILVDPTDVLLRDAPDQHFLGDDVIVAPVLEQGATSRSVVLPAGTWYGLLDGGRWEQAATAAVDVAAPVTEIPVFVRAGALLPLLDPDVVTTHPARGEVVDAGDREDRVDLMAFHGADGAVDLVGGGSFAWTSTGAVAAGPLTWNDAATTWDAPCEDARAWDCREAFGPGEAVYRVSWGTEGTLAGPGWTLAVSGGAGRRGVLTVRY